MSPGLTKSVASKFLLCRGEQIQNISNNPEQEQIAFNAVWLSELLLRPPNFFCVGYW